MAYFYDLENTNIQKLNREHFLFYPYQDLDKISCNRALLLDAIQSEIKNICELFKYEEVSFQKLYWWEDEISKISSKSCTHPLLKELIKNFDSDLIEDVIETLLHTINEKKVLFHRPEFETFQELQDFILNSEFLIEKLKVKLFQEDLDNNKKDLENIVIYFTLIKSYTNLLALFPTYLKNKIHILPKEVYTKYSESLNNFESFNKDNQFKIFENFALEIFKIHKKFDILYKNLSKNEKKDFRQLRVQQIYYCKWLKKCSKKSYPILKYKVKILPIHFALWQIFA